ncbi:MAG: hypothetical protein JNK49_10310 [Planctomycetes bacterium]|nr:hypothetical protein [Planctomycetota bacterium]
MKRRSEHLVRKRDGRTEFLRATKLARSIHLALQSVGVDEDWRALDLADVVLIALRQRAAANAEVGVAAGGGRDAVPLDTAALADAVQHVLVVTGQPQAAVAYGAVAAERQRRRRSLATLGRFDGGALPVDGGTLAPELPMPLRSRLGQE